MTTLNHLVLASAARRGDAVAVRQWDVELSYRELVGRAFALATTLRGHGVGPETRVGVCTRRHPGLLVAVLGVLFAGGCYVPVDHALPRRRRTELAADADLTVAVVDDTGADAMAGIVPTLVPIPVTAVTDPAAADLSARRPERPTQTTETPDTRCSSAGVAGSAAGVTPPAWPAVPAPVAADGAAYVLYTSGSTGRPKGVVVSHRNVVAHVLAFGTHAGAGESTRALAFASLGFDASVQDLFIPLAFGGEIALVPDADRVDPARLQRFAEEHQVNWGFLPAALLPLLRPERLPRWHTVFTGVEAPDPGQVHRWTGSAPRRFSNGYGPTEATVCVTSFVADGHWDRPVPIGRPLPGHHVHLVDDQLRPVPQGVPGEVLIGGDGLARGYLGQPGLTALRFVPDPFCGVPGTRLYRTGDRAVWQPDGELLFLGRLDRQVKVRGQRVELAEVEAVLATHPAVRDAAVVAIPGPDGHDLVAIVTTGAATSTGAAASVDPAIPAGAATPAGPADLISQATPGAVVSGAEVLEFARARLPEVMVPRRVVLVAALPLGAAGKRDAVALRELALWPPAGEADAEGGAARPPVSPAEVAVAAAWCSVLGGEPGLDDDFFAAGGTSLSAMRLVARLRDQLGRDVSVEDVFTARTLGALAERVDGAATLAGPELSTGHPPTLSPAQRRLWFLDQLAPDSAAYNTAMAERLRGPLDVDALRAALTAVADRHEVLRWRITRVAGTPHVTCAPPEPAELTVLDLTAVPGDEREARLRGLLRAGAATRFDLATGPLWRAELYRLAADEHVLALSFHHAVFDGWSQAVLYDQLGAAYAGRPLAPPRAGYADYAVWRAERDRADGAADLAWWAEHLAGAPTVLEVPADHPRPAEQTYRGEFATRLFSPSLDDRARELATSLGTTASTVLLAAFAEVLRRVTTAADATATVTDRRADALARPADGRDDRAGAGDFVVGAVVADRRLAAVEDLVGFFVEIAPVRLRPDGAASFTEQVLACRQEMLDVLAHPNAPLERIVRALSVPRDPTRPPLVQVLFNVFTVAEPALELPGVRSERVPAGLPGSPFDLTVYLVERDGRLALDAVFNPDLFGTARVGHLLDGYLALLEALTAAPTAPMSTVDGGPALALAAVDPAPVRPPSTGGDDRNAQHGLPERPTRATGMPNTDDRNAQHADGTRANELGRDELVGGTEVLVAGVWERTLGRTGVRALDNFFDVGGHSAAMVLVQHGLAEATGRELALVELFRFPTVRSLAAHLDGAQDRGGLDHASRRAATRRELVRGRRAAAARTRVTARDTARNTEVDR